MKGEGPPAPPAYNLPMTVKLFRVILPVADIEQAAKFYGNLFEGEGERISPGRHYFECEGTILACYDAAADGDPGATGPNPEHLYFAVDDLEAAYARVREGGGTLESADDPGTGPMGEITMRPWGERSFYARDPFGNGICLVDRATMFTGEA